MKPASYRQDENFVQFQKLPPGKSRCGASDTLEDLEMADFPSVIAAISEAGTLVMKIIDYLERLRRFCDDFIPAVCLALP